MSTQRPRGDGGSDVELTDERRADVARALLESEGADGIDVRIGVVAQRVGAPYASVAVIFWQMVREGILDRYGRRT